jgi:DsbC/DsbD-like thiol-disulfide interchange protein
MKLLLLLILIYPVQTFAQSDHPVKWNFRLQPTNAETELKFSAAIEKGWHIYGQNTADGGPLPMLITYDSATCYTLSGKTMEPKPIEEMDSIFGVSVQYFMGKAELTQKVVVTSTPCKITGRIEYQACKDACIPLDTTFTFVIPK